MSADGVAKGGAVARVDARREADAGARLLVEPAADADARRGAAVAPRLVVEPEADARRPAGFAFDRREGVGAPPGRRIIPSTRSIASAKARAFSSLRPAASIAFPPRAPRTRRRWVIVWERHFFRSARSFVSVRRSAAGDCSFSAVPTVVLRTPNSALVQSGLIARSDASFMRESFRSWGTVGPFVTIREQSRVRGDRSRARGSTPVMTPGSPDDGSQRTLDAASAMKHAAPGAGRVAIRGWAPSLPRRGRSVVVECVRPFVWMLARLIHRVRYEGWERVPMEIGPEGLIVAANHTAGLDPVLAQVRIGALIRWMMDRTQMKRVAGWFWRRLRVIPVDFGPGDAAAFRETLAHLRSGGVVGVFPEGGLERPPEQIRPFLPGVGALVARSRAPVLLLWIHGGPKHPRVFRSLLIPSRSVVTVVGVYRFEGREARDVRGIAEHLRRELARASGWPLHEEPLPHHARDATSARG